MSTDAKPQARTDVYPGDVVYFDHPSGALSGRVLAHGKHGCTIECKGGKRHKVKWEKVLGHKKRAALRGGVLEKGGDGMIVKDANGRRRFIATDENAPLDRVVTGAPKPKKAPEKTAPRENPKRKKAAPTLRKSEYFPTILLWSR